ncbi:MAG: NADH-quinone oxidoreductase subunit N [Myxococcaceae bacterium]
MTLPDITSADLLPVVPALILTVGGCVLLLSEVFLTTSSRSHLSLIGFVTSVLAGVVALSTAFEPGHLVFGGLGVQDPFSSFLTVVVCVGLGLAVLMSAGFLHQRNAERGEFYALMLFAGAGMSLLAMSAELVTLFISLEVLSVSTYALTAFLRKGPRPAEAGFKYFILGAFSAALFLYGVALLYGATGTTRLADMAGPLNAAMKLQPGLVLCGLGLLAAGFAFKVAAVPFHMWTPDVYEGAPTPVTALMSAGVKAAAFAGLVRVFMFLGRSPDTDLPFLALGGLALLTMVGGNLMALPQRNVKRMLAYSSIAHAGYILLGVTTLFVRPGTGVLGAASLLGGPPTVNSGDALKGILFYLLAYTVSAVGAFGVVAVLERKTDEDGSTAWDMDRFSGLAQRRPGWAVAMAVFMLSLSGIPPTVGFMGKLLIFRTAVDSGLLGLAILGVLASAVGAYYYLRVVVYMFMRPAAADAPVPESQWTTEVALMASALGVVALGVLPGRVAGWLSQAGMLFGAQ